MIRSLDGRSREAAVSAVLATGAMEHGGSLPASELALKNQQEFVHQVQSPLPTWQGL